MGGGWGVELFSSELASRDLIGRFTREYLKEMTAAAAPLPPVAYL